MRDYIKVTYQNKPKTTYPEKLIRYLFKTKNSYVKKVFKPYDRVLDLGCGRGDHLLAFCQNGFKVEGFDQCPPEEDVNKSYEIVLGNIELPLPYSNDCFDLVFCKSVIEHLYYPEKVFKEVNRILKPDGGFVCLTPDYNSTKEVFHEDFTHITPFTIKSLNDIFSIHGFRDINCNYFIQLPFLWRYKWLLIICLLTKMFYTKNTKFKLIKFSKEKMLIGVGRK